ncbi:ribonuclease E/G [Pseudactinotalea terrae]|uniref:ribonuclease E/G n=1 Tax=Pseudactinotalea terrae TaxID=1743262 RepID=UPI0012E0CAC2|nr:ribonuclease E/G [Pseudactinotalea terrae]
MTPDRPTLDVLAELGLAPAEPEPEAAQEEPAQAPEPADEGAPEQVPAEETAEVADAEEAAEPAADDESVEALDEAPESQDEEEASPRLPATALLFQAPDLTPRRRRRASAPAGAPQLPADEEPTSQRQSGPQDEPERTSEKAAGTESSDEPEKSTEDSEDKPEGDDSSAPRRRRRRGGRGRRKAKGDDSSSDDDSANDEPTDDGESADEANRSEKSDEPKGESRGRRRRGKKADDAETAADSTEPKADDADSETENDESGEGDEGGESNRSRRRRRRRSRSTRDEGARARDEVTALKGSTRLEAKRQRRREGRDSNRRRSIITEAEFLARRESVDRAMVVRSSNGRTQIAVLEDDVLVEHFVARKTQTSMVGNVYLGRVQNVLPGMEAAFVDLGRGRNAVLYAGEVNWDAAGLEGQPRRIEQALSSGDSVLVQVTKDPIGHKGARLTSQITLAGRYLVLVPSGSMTGISRKLPDTERNRLKKLLKEIVPEGQGVIVRTAAEGASEEELRRDVERLTKNWDDIQKKVNRTSTSAPTLLKGEPELATRVVRDVFNEDFASLTVQGDDAWKTISEYVESVAPDLTERLHHWTDEQDVFAAHRIDEQLAKGLDRKVWLPSGGSLVIDRTEAMTVVDVNTGKFTGSGGTLEETVTKNNLEAAEEIVRQLRLRDIGGIIVIDFIDMVLESNRDLVLRRLVECLGRDRTRHQVAEVTSLGLVQMTRKRVGQGLFEAFSTSCEHCHGRGVVFHDEPVESGAGVPEESEDTPRSGRGGRRGRRSNSNGQSQQAQPQAVPEPTDDPVQRAQVRATLAAIAAAAAHAHDEQHLDTEPHPSPLTAEDSLESVVELEAQETVVAVAVAEPEVAVAETAATPEETAVTPVEPVESPAETPEPAAETPEEPATAEPEQSDTADQSEPAEQSEPEVTQHAEASDDVGQDAPAS